MSKYDGSYEITVDSVGKTVNIYVSGSANPEAIQEFLNEYNSKTSKIQVSDFTLIVDCQEMSVETQDKVQKLEEVFKMYQQTGFKDISFKVKASNGILKMQLNRIIRNSGVSNAKLLEV